MSTLAIEGSTRSRTSASGMAVPLEVVDSESLRRIFEVNVIGQMALTRAMTPLVRIAEGRIVFVGSIGDRLTVPFAGPPTASKAAIASPSDTLRQELAPWGIRVILVEPANSYPAVDAMNAEVQRTSEASSAAHAQLYGESYRGSSRSSWSRRSTVPRK